MNINKNDAQGFLNMLNALSAAGVGQYALAIDETTTVIVNVQPNGQMGVARVATVVAVLPDVSEVPWSPGPDAEPPAADNITPLVVAEAAPEAPAVAEAAPEAPATADTASEPINPNDVPLSSTGS